MKQELVQVASYATQIEAEYIVSVLHGHQIKAFADGASTNTTLSHVGSALGGVRVLTRSEDVEAAWEIIDNLKEETNESGEAWYCTSCQEFVEASFQVCWGCERDRSEVEGVPPATAQPAELADEHRNELRPGQAAQSFEPVNPYRAPGVRETISDDKSPIREPSLELEEMVTRAYRASLLGFVLLPFVVHAYSVYLLIVAAARFNDMPDHVSRLWHRTFIINMIVGFGWVILLSVLM